MCVLSALFKTVAHFCDRIVPPLLARCPALPASLASLLALLAPSTYSIFSLTPSLSSLASLCLRLLLCLLAGNSFCLSHTFLSFTLRAQLLIYAYSHTHTQILLQTPIYFHTHYPHTLPHSSALHNQRCAADLCNGHKMLAISSSFDFRALRQPLPLSCHP